MASPLLALEELSVGFRVGGEVLKALDGISLTIPSNRIVGVVGESGSGKSTVALALMGLLPSNATSVVGRMAFDGKRYDLANRVELERLRGDRIAMVFQDPMTALNPVFTIGTQLVDAQRRKQPGLRVAELRERARVILGRVGMTDTAERLGQFPHELSGGMRQRVMIAMALLAEPRLLIADEATTALDVTIEAQIMTELETLRGAIEGSILLVSHSLGLVSQICDEVVVLYAGRVVESATTHDLFTGARHPYTKALISCERPSEPETRRFRSIPGSVPRLVDRPKGCIFAARCPSAMDRCRSEVPPWRGTESGHGAACWLA
ncbi:MAG: ABC transporter ATP-binding protein [Hyphomicrobiaceae bacterium]